MIRVGCLVAGLSCAVGCAPGQRTQMMYEIEVHKGDQRITCPRIITYEGESARIQIDEDGRSIVVDVHADGRVTGHETVQGRTTTFENITWTRTAIDASK